VRQAARAALREHRAVVVLAVSVATLLVFAIVILPPLLAGGDDSENDVRSTLLQGLAGLFLAAGLYFTAQTLRLNRESAERTSESAERTYRLEREGQITERFTRAIEQLGDEKREVRLGGIYALERIAKSSTEDHGPIMEVLTAYVRLHAPWPPRPADEGEEAGSAEHRERDEDGAPPTDVQAVIAVLGRRVLGRTGEHALDLSSVDLRGARFGKGAGEGHFEGANFFGAKLEGVDLRDAHFSGANFYLASLRGAYLMRANLTGAKLEVANLEHADLEDAVYDSETTWPSFFDPKAEGARLVEGLKLRE
jgi:Pentapeptide repeats (8 copies)